MKKTSLGQGVIILSVLLLSLGLRPLRADSISLSVSVNTSGLGSSSPSEVFVTLTDGSGVGDTNNTAKLTNFVFGVGGSGGAVDMANTSGGVSGDLLAGVSLTDSMFTNTFAAFFTAGGQLVFNLNLTTNLDAGATPDQFALAIVNPTGSLLPSSDPTGSGNLLVINIDSKNPAATRYSSLVTVSGPQATPEPSTLTLIVIGLGSVASRRVRLRKTHLIPKE